MFKLLLELLLLIRFLELFREFSKIVLRVFKLSFLTETVDKIGKTNGDVFEVNLMRLSSEGFLKVVGILKVFVTLEGFFFNTSKYFFIYEVAISFSLVDSFGLLISLIAF